MHGGFDTVACTYCALLYILLVFVCVFLTLVTIRFRVMNETDQQLNSTFALKWSCPDKYYSSAVDILWEIIFFSHQVNVPILHTATLVLGEQPRPQRRQD